MPYLTFEIKSQTNSETRNDVQGTFLGTKANSFPTNVLTSRSRVSPPTPLTLITLIDLNVQLDIHVRLRQEVKSRLVNWEKENTLGLSSWNWKRGIYLLTLRKHGPKKRRDLLRQQKMMIRGSSHQLPPSRRLTLMNRRKHVCHCSERGQLASRGRKIIIMTFIISK